MGLFVLQCKHRQGDSSNPGNVIESPCSTRHFCHDLELHRGDLISSPVDSIVSLVSPKKVTDPTLWGKIIAFLDNSEKGRGRKIVFPHRVGSVTFLVKLETLYYQLVKK